MFKTNSLVLVFFRTAKVTFCHAPWFRDPGSLMVQIKGSRQNIEHWVLQGPIVLKKIHKSFADIMIKVTFKIVSSVGLVPWYDPICMPCNSFSVLSPAPSLIPHNRFALFNSGTTSRIKCILYWHWALRRGRVVCGRKLFWHYKLWKATLWFVWNNRLYWPQGKYESKTYWKQNFVPGGWGWAPGAIPKTDSKPTIAGDFFSTSMLPIQDIRHINIANGRVCVWD